MRKRTAVAITVGTAALFTVLGLAGNHVTDQSSTNTPSISAVSYELVTNNGAPAVERRTESAATITRELVTNTPCPTEDSDNCHWDAATQGNGQGQSFTVTDGVVTYDGR